MKIRIKKSVLLQVVKQVLTQGTPQHPDPKGTNIRRVLRRAQDAGQQGASWTQLHNAINNKGQDSSWSNQNRGNNVSAIARCAGRPSGNTEQGTAQVGPYDDNPLISKLQNGNYTITQRGIIKLRQLDQQLGKQ